MLTYNGASYTWMGRELRKITNGSNTYSYKYNADGIRTSKTVNGTTTEFFLNGSQILAQKTGDSVMRFFYDSTGKRVGFANGTMLFYYLYNVQGDVIAIVRAATGQVVAKYSYDAWGNCTVTNATGYGKAGTTRVRVYIPPHDPERAARNRAQLNRVLARYGYKLVEREADRAPQAPDAS